MLYVTSMDIQEALKGLLNDIVTTTHPKADQVIRSLWSEVQHYRGASNKPKPMTKFKAKPIVIEAVQWFKNGDHPLDYSDEYTQTEGKLVRYFRDPEISGHSKCKVCGNIMHDHGLIENNGGYVVCPGDMIIKRDMITKGRSDKIFYPINPDQFAVWYEPIEPHWDK